MCDQPTTFVFDSESGRSEKMNMQDPDSVWVDELIEEAKRQERTMFEYLKGIVDRQFKIAQLWLAFTGLFLVSGLFGGGQPLDIWVAIGFGIGFGFSILGLAARSTGPNGPGMSDFNDWMALRRSTNTNKQILLSTWEEVLKRKQRANTRRIRHLNVTALLLSGYAVLVIIIRAYVMWGKP